MPEPSKSFVSVANSILELNDFVKKHDILHLPIQQAEVINPQTLKTLATPIVRKENEVGLFSCLDEFEKSND